MHQEDKIVILGCGFIGMITALSLASRGIKTTIFEKQSMDDLKSIKDSRNIALTHNSQKWLLLNKLWGLLEHYVACIKDVYVIDNKDEESILQLNATSNESAMGYMIMSTDFQRILLDSILSNDNINLICSSSYTDIVSSASSSDIVFNDYTVKANVVLVCDGKNSLAMQKYSSYFLQKDYKQTALVFTVSHEKPHENTAVEHFLSSGVFAILPTINQYESSIVWIESDISAALLLKKDDISHELLERFGPFLGDVKITSKILSYGLTASLINNYYHNKLIFVGDSAHVIHPLAGQGLNQGIEDARSIVEIMSKIYSLGLEIREEYLRAYQRQRFRANLSMFMLTNSLEKLFVNDHKMLSSLRKFGLRFIESSPTLKSLISSYSMQKKFF